MKKTLLTGALAVGLIGSSSLAFANTNAGTQFTTWGQAQIDAAKTAIQNSIGASRTTAQSGINTKATTDRNASEGRINQAGTDEKADTKNKIEAKLAEHVSSLQAALATFMSTIGGDFDALVLAEKSKTTGNLNSQYTDLQINITSVLNAAKETQKKEVTEASLLVKGKATSDLIKEINRVKSELAATIANEKATAQGEVDAHLLSEVNRINGQLDALILGLETTAKNVIADAGQEVENSAYTNFERVIALTGTETPIKVDKQKLSWSLYSPPFDNKVKIKVTNSNEFDVVFQYKFETFNGSETGGVSETPFAKSSVNPGEKVLEFIVPDGFLNIDMGGRLVIEYLDENGQFKRATEIALY